MNNSMTRRMMEMTALVAKMAGAEKPDASRIAADAKVICSMFEMLGSPEIRRDAVQTNLMTMAKYDPEDFSALFAILETKLASDEIEEMKGYVDTFVKNDRKIDESRMEKFISRVGGGVDRLVNDGEADSELTAAVSRAGKLARLLGIEADSEEDCDCINCRLREHSNKIQKAAKVDKDKALELFKDMLAEEGDWGSDAFGMTVQTGIAMHRADGIDTTELLDAFTKANYLLYTVYEEDDGFGLAMVGLRPRDEESYEKTLNAIRSDIYETELKNEKAKWGRDAEIRTALAYISDNLTDRKMSDTLDRLRNAIMQYEDVFPEFKAGFDRYREIFETVKAGNYKL